jgi:hypothetical protein
MNKQEVPLFETDIVGLDSIRKVGKVLYGLVAADHPLHRLLRAKLAQYDQQYAVRLKEALAFTGIVADIDLVHATEARMSPKYAFLEEIQPLIQKYGQGVTPALFINHHLILYGRVPTVEKLVETLEKARIAIEQGRL